MRVFVALMCLFLPDRSVHLLSERKAGHRPQVHAPPAAPPDTCAESHPTHTHTQQKNRQRRRIDEDEEE